MSSRTLGKYRLLAELGQGGMATVYLAVANQSAAFFAKLVVIKLLREHLASDAEFITMFVDEARIAARLNHPNLVQTLEVGQEKDRYYLTMEYLDGQPLHRILKRARERLPSAMFYGLLVDVLDGIHYAHELRDFDGTPLDIVHRDVTPHNVFVVYEGQVKVVDFGIAKAAGRASETRHGVIKGKVAYMAPEQALGRIVDRRADVFAVGVMLFEAATRKRMWSGLKETEIVRCLASGKIPRAKDVDPTIDDELDAICAKALASAPQARYATAAAFQADLAAYLEKQGPRPSPRALGAFVAELFADKRAATSTLIETQLAEIRSEGAVGPQHKLPSLPTSTSDLVAAEPSSDPSLTPASTPPPVDPISVEFVPLETPSVATSADDWRRLVLVAAAALALALMATIVTLLLLRPTTTPPPPTITVTLRATPLDARFSIDDGPLLDNPFIGTYPADEREHKVRAVAFGCTPKQETVRFEKNVTVSFALTEVPSATPTGSTKKR